jgi:hypothetical protein
MVFLYIVSGTNQYQQLASWVGMLRGDCETLVAFVHVSCYITWPKSWFLNNSYAEITCELRGGKLLLMT